MGNSNSQSNHLSLSRFTPSVLHGKETRNKKPTKFANPQNRVLPIAAAGQRLRSTDNGNILHSGGTISGRKSSVLSLSTSQPEFLQLLQKPFKDGGRNSQNVSYQTLYGHRKSHSDPDIVRMMMHDNEEEDEEEDEGDEADANGNMRSIIAVSPSKAKIKSRKKKKAPEPPHSNTLPRSLDRMPAFYMCERANNETKKVSVCRKTDLVETPRRPLPPIPPEELPPPPPPPPPDYNRDVEDAGMMKMPSKNYEKNRRTVDKWKLSKNVLDSSKERESKRRSKSLDRTEDKQIRESDEMHRKCRMERNNSLRDVSCGKIQSVALLEKKITPGCDELKEAIENAARRRAQRMEKNFRNSERVNVNGGNLETKASMQYKMKKEQRIDSSKAENIKQYYFSDIGNLQTMDNSLSQCMSVIQPNQNCVNFKAVCEENDIGCFAPKNVTEHKPIERDFEKEVEDRCQQMKESKKGEDVYLCANRERQTRWGAILHDPIRPFLQERNPLSSSSSDEEMEIDLQLRPTLPRRPVDLPRFSPTEVWKSINLDFFKSHQQRSDVSSDEGDVLEEKIHRINRPVAPRRSINDRSADSGISPDAGSPMLLNESFEALLSNNLEDNLHPSPPPAPEGAKSAWVPQQDLLDDMDTASEVSRGSQRQGDKKTDVQAKLSLPNLMLPSRSLVQADQQNGLAEREAFGSSKEKTKNRGCRKKNCKNAEGQHFNSLRNLKKVLGLRAKTQAVAIVENRGLDPNWSLSRSLPNFINNLNVMETGKEKQNTEKCFTLEHIRRSNSESRTSQQALNNESAGKETDAGFCQEMKIQSHSQWRNAFHGYPSEGHVIYLPQYQCVAVNEQCKSRQQDMEDEKNPKEVGDCRMGNRNKFSYQSTLRQEERKKLEEQLTREVEERERKRQEEIEWMNKVEEEFRKQRDKEKVNIRHQLRILHLQEKNGDQGTVVGNESETKPDIGETCLSDQNCSATDQQYCDRWNGNGRGKAFFPADFGAEFQGKWKQPTGMRKWLRCQNNGRVHSFSPLRPEPEGGRSSSDDCKKLERKRERVLGEHSQSTLANGSGPKMNPERKDADPLGRWSRSPSPKLNEKMKRDSKDDETQQVEQYDIPGDSGDRDDNNFLAESVEEYGVHTRLCRTGSGRTFESHSYYVLERHNETLEDEMKSRSTKEVDGPKSAHSLFSSVNFEKELKENVRKKTRELEKRSRKVRVTINDSDSESDVERKRSVNGVQKNQRSKSKKPTQSSRRARNGEGESSPDEQLNVSLSFSRNHPHRNGARGKIHVNGHPASKPRTLDYSPEQEREQNRVHSAPQHQRISASVLG